MNRAALILNATACLGGAALGMAYRPASAMFHHAGTTRTIVTQPVASPSNAFLDSTDGPRRVEELLAAPQVSRHALQALFMRWFELEPDLWPKFQELEKQHPDHAADLTSAFFTAWAWRDCAAACEKIRGSALKHRSAGIAAVWQVACALGDASGAGLEAGFDVKDWSSLSRLAARNPQAALALADGLRDSSNPPGSLVAIARGWASRDGAAAAAWAANLKDDSGQPLDTTGAVFREACLAWEQQQPGALRRTEGKLRKRIESDGVLALLGGKPGIAAIVNGNAEAQLKALQNPFATMQEVLAGMNQASAAEMTRVNSHEYPSPTGEWSPVDLKTALSELLTQPAGSARDRLAETLLERWEAADPAAAADFANTTGMPLPSRRESPGEAWKKVDGLPLAEAVAVAMPEGKAPDLDALSAAIKQHVKHDPAMVTAFLDQHMDQITKGEGPWRMALRAAAYQWSQMDVNAAVEWAASLPAGPVRDEAIGRTLHELGDYDPEAALTWMAAMHHPESGSMDFRGIADELEQRIGKYGARFVIEASALPAEKKQELMQHLR